MECRNEARHGIAGENQVAVFRVHNGPSQVEVLKTEAGGTQFGRDRASPAFSDMDEVEWRVRREDRHGQVRIHHATSSYWQGLFFRLNPHTVSGTSAIAMAGIIVLIKGFV